jgi:hypothetical protein
VLTDPGLTAEQARAVGDWVAGRGDRRHRQRAQHRPRTEDTATGFFNEDTRKIILSSWL